MDFFNTNKLWYNGSTRHELLLRNSLQFNFIVTAIGIVQQKNWNSFVCYKEYLFVLTFKKLICTFNILRKFAIIHKRSCEAGGCLQLIGSKHCKAVGEVWPETRSRDYRSRSDSYLLRSCCAIKSTATWQWSEIWVSILLGIRSQCILILSWRLIANRIGLQGTECVQINQRQHVFAGQSPCVKIFKSECR